MAIYEHGFRDSLGSRDEVGREVGRDEVGRYEVGRYEVGREEVGREEVGREEVGRKEVGRLLAIFTLAGTACSFLTNSADSGFL